MLFIFMEEIIKQLGLDSTEAKVYVALLELGPSTVTEITKKAGITRTLGYHVLEKMGVQGLVSRSSGESKKINYVAENPRNLLQFVKNQKNSWERRVDKAEQVLPDLLSLYRIAEKPVVRFQPGTSGVVSLFEESLESTTEILAVADVDSWKVPEFWDWAKGYNKERNKRKIKERILILKTSHGKEWLKHYPGSPYTIYRWVEPSQIANLLEFGGELNVYENKVAMALLKKPNRMGVIIESTALANIMRALFELVWSKAESASKR